MSATRRDLQPWGPQRPSLYTGHLLKGEPGKHGPFSNPCSQVGRPIPGFSLPPNNGQFPLRLWTPLPLVTAGTLGLQPRPQHTGRFKGHSSSFLPQFLERRAHLRGCLTFVPKTQLSQQVNQDYNHNSKDRIVLLFSFFFLKGVRAWKIQHTNETKCQKKIQKNRK